MFKIENLNPSSATPLYAQIIERVKEAISTGELIAGESLPSVRGLAKELKVNSLTIQKAYKNLAAEELITIRKGIGAFVNEEIKPVKEVSKYKLIEDKLSPIIAQAKSMNLELEPILESTEKLWRKK